MTSCAYVFVFPSELSRYLHARLDTPIGEYNIDSDLDGTMKDRWVKSKPFEDKGYVELPGLSPEIRLVLIMAFSNLCFYYSGLSLKPLYTFGAEKKKSTQIYI